MTNERITALFEAIYGRIVKVSDQDTFVDNYLLAWAVVYEIYDSVTFNNPLTEDDLYNLLCTFLREQTRSLDN